MQEIWKPISGYESLYAVSNFGNVKALDRFLYKKNGRICHWKERVIKPSLQILPRGYKRYRVNLTWNFKSKQFKVHRLVADAFIPNPDNKPNVNHIDNNPLNNNVSNLEWCTNEENLQHSARQGRLNRGENNNQAKLKPEDVISIREMNGCSVAEKRKIATTYNLSMSYVNSLMRGTTWKHLL